MDEKPAISELGDGDAPKRSNSFAMTEDTAVPPPAAHTQVDSATSQAVDNVLYSDVGY